MSMSYVLYCKTGSTWRIASILGNFPLLYMEGNEAKVIKSALKNARIHNLYYFEKRRVGLLCVFDHCLCEPPLVPFEAILVPFGAILVPFGATLDVIFRWR